jgi:choline monooxygenase
MIDPDIRIASTPNGELYLSESHYRLITDRVFAKSWQYIGDRTQFAEKGYLHPIMLMPGCLDEPLILSVQEDTTQLMSNVCTHRGFVLLSEKIKSQVIRCKYHGRCFHPDGTFMSMPEFEEAKNFPTRMDDLARAQVSVWKGLYFASLFPQADLHDILKPVADRLHWFPFDKLQFRADLSQDYDVKANWALYCDNYLEGFHIPFVHKSLNRVIDYHAYETHLFPHGNLQLGIAKEGELTFDLPTDAEDYGKQVAAYYYWIFPNMMLNFYPWGLSLNIVQPQGIDNTRVSFYVFVSDPDKHNTGAGSDLNRVELEDEEVVESVHRGLRSRLYFRGRYSPKMEKGVHQFHQLLYTAIQQP